MANYNNQEFFKDETTPKNQNKILTKPTLDFSCYVNQIKEKKITIPIEDKS